jgi:hypothetical protein
MERNSGRQKQRGVARIAAALGLSAATIPVVLGALAEPSAAATSSGSSTISAQQVVAAAECDIAWVEMDVKYLLVTAGTPITPSCAPVPAGAQESISTLLYDYCLLTDELGGSHGICIPPATTPDDA